MGEFWWLTDCIQYGNQRKLQKKSTLDSFRQGITPLPILLFQEMRG